MLWTVLSIEDLTVNKTDKKPLFCAALSHVWLFVTPRTVAHQASLPTGFSRQEHWSGLPFPPPGDLPDPGIKTSFLVSAALAGAFFTPVPPGKALAAQMVRNLPAVQETWVWSLGQEDPLKEERAIHSSILAWRIPWTEEPGGLRFTGLQRVGHNWVTKPLSYEELTFRNGKRMGKGGWAQRKLLFALRVNEHLYTFLCWRTFRLLSYKGLLLSPK